MFQSDVAGSIIHGCLLSHHWPKGSQCWTWWSLLRPIAAQETLLSWKDFKNYVNEKIFLVAYYYKIIVQKALLSWQDLTKRLSMVNLVIFLEAQETPPSWKDLKNYVNKKTFLVAYYYKKVVQKALLSWQDLQNLCSKSIVFLDRICKILWTRTQKMVGIRWRVFFTLACNLPLASLGSTHTI